MYKLNNKICAEVGYYLSHKNRKEIGFTLNGDTTDNYEEMPLSNPMEFTLEGNLILFKSSKAAFYIPDIDKASIKTYIIKTRYSPDDQIAILLNKDRSEEHLNDYNRMQEWREFASMIANKITET